MNEHRKSRLRGWLRAGLLCALAAAPPAQAQDAASLKARHVALRETLANNAFQRPLWLESQENAGDLKGDIYVRLDRPFAAVKPALRDVSNWCDILILHINVKLCRATPANTGDTLSLVVGRKAEQPLAEAYAVEFTYQVEVDRSDYLHVTLNAAEGPLGTRDYRIVLEVVALDAGRSFLHLSYAYAYGLAARVAMQGYLATIGRDKVGFTVVGRQANGDPTYIGSTRGVVERNTMRYYLAIEAYLDAQATSPQQQQDKRLNNWYSAVERYPLQLHELERAEYLNLKRGEIRRQQALGG